MKMRTLIIINAVIQFMFGAGFLFLPAVLLGLFGTQTDVTGIMMTRVVGATVLSLGIVSWLGKDASGSGLEAIVWGSIAAHGLAGILTLFSVLSGTFNAFGWSAVIMDAVLVAAFLWVRQSSAK